MDCPSSGQRIVKSWVRLLLPVIVALLAMIAYTLTLRPEVDWGDSAELSLQAYVLGVTHPPGYPLHTFLGHVFTWIIPDAGLATNLLSALSVGLAVAVLSATIERLTEDPFASLFAALVFAFNPYVWDTAVVTEVYGVSLLFTALAIWVVLLWCRAPSALRLMGVGGAVGLALAASLANVLLLPAMGFLVWRRCAGRRLRRKVVCQTGFLGTASLVVLLVLSWSYFRSQAVSPLGSVYVPDTPRRFLLYLTGAQYEPTRVHHYRYYLERLVEHASFFKRAFGWGGIAYGLGGMILLWEEQRSWFVALFLIFGSSFGYFTIYQATDYYRMALLAHYAFAIAVGVGVHGLVRVAHRRAFPGWLVGSLRVLLLISGAIIVLLAVSADLLGSGLETGFGPTQVRLVLLGSLALLFAALLRRPAIRRWVAAHGPGFVLVGVTLPLVLALGVVQYRLHEARSHQVPVTEFVLLSFDLLPENAIVVAEWDRFTPLLHAQVTQGARRDLIILEPIAPWETYLRRHSTGRAVYAHLDRSRVDAHYRALLLPHGWYRLYSVPRPSAIVR